MLFAIPNSFHLIFFCQINVLIANRRWKKASTALNLREYSLLGTHLNSIQFMTDKIAYSRWIGMWFNLDDSINPNEKKIKCSTVKFLYPIEWREVKASLQFRIWSKKILNSETGRNPPKKLCRKSNPMSVVYNQPLTVDLPELCVSFYFTLHCTYLIEIHRFNTVRCSSIPNIFIGFQREICWI